MAGYLAGRLPLSLFLFGLRIQFITSFHIREVNIYPVSEKINRFERDFRFGEKGERGVREGLKIKLLCEENSCGLYQNKVRFL